MDLKLQLCDYEAKLNETTGGYDMSESIILAVLGIIGTLSGTILTQIVHIKLERSKSIEKAKQDRYETKREKLSDIYNELISIINLFPNISPNDVLQFVENGPIYSLENFEGVLSSLDIQIDHYKKQLSIKDIDYERKSNIETHISNREYSKKKIIKIRDKYYLAKEKYKSFCESDKIVFDLYAGQDVRNHLVKFDVIIHNTFISGYRAGEDCDPINNINLVTKRNLINSIRNDIGIY